jgi:thiol-disulfide isomerase/thioredoxin
MRRALALVLLAGLALGCGDAGPSGGGSGEPVEAAPDFTLESLSGGKVTLSEHQGKTVIVDFWATWCPPCVFQVPELNKLHAAHADAGDVVVIGVAIDVEGESIVRPWAEENGIEYIVALGDEKLATEFGALGFPTLIVIRPDGSIESRHVGLIEYDTLEELVSTAAST